MFHIIKKEDNSYVFHLKSDQDVVIVSSKEYTNMNDIQEEINHITQNTQLDRIFERKTTKSGQFYFNILDNEMSPTAVSQFFNSKAGLENGIKAAKKYAVLNSKIY